MKNSNSEINNYDVFMKYFRENEKLNELSIDDRIEIFSTILLGNSDFVKTLFDNIFSDFCIIYIDEIETTEI